jgi:phage terminase large subunit-like protein
VSGLVGEVQGQVTAGIRETAQEARGVVREARDQAGELVHAAVHQGQDVIRGLEVTADDTTYVAETRKKKGKEETKKNQV